MKITAIILFLFAATSPILTIAQKVKEDPIDIKGHETISTTESVCRYLYDDIEEIGYIVYERDRDDLNRVEKYHSNVVREVFSERDKLNIIVESSIGSIRGTMAIDRAVEEEDLDFLDNYLEFCRKSMTEMRWILEEAYPETIIKNNSEKIK